MGSKPRTLVLALSIAAHLGLLGMFAISTTAPSRSFEVGAMYVSLDDGAAVTPQTAAPSPKLMPAEVVSPLPDIEIQAAPTTPIEPILVGRSLPEALPEFESEQTTPDLKPMTAAAAPRALARGETCQLTQWIQDALRQDDSVREALSAIPREARSLANAIMLWDGRWVETATMSAGQVLPIRDAIILGVRTAPAACRDEEMRGPLLIAVPDRFGTTLLAVGSGAWRWSDLLPDAALPRA